MLVLYHSFTVLCHDSVELVNGRIIRSRDCPGRIWAILCALSYDGFHQLQELPPLPVPPLPDPPHPQGMTNGVTNGATNSTTNGTTNGMTNGRTNDFGPPISKFITETHDAWYLRYLQDIHGQWVQLGMIDPAGTILPDCSRLPSAARAGAAPREPKHPAARPGYYSFDLSSGIAIDSWSAIVVSAELAVEAFHRKYSNEEKPPQIAILDIDFNHGNGTQDYFFTDPSVVYVSIHGEDEYPYYTGHASERGAGNAQDANLNLPLATGSSAEEYIKKLDQAVEFLEAAEPEYLVVSLGFNTYYRDPQGFFDIQTEDYVRIGARIRCQSGLQDIPAVLLLEGGYDTETLGANLLAFLEGWENRF
ncbi:uncharacterized protein DNG_02769 [Cephalotrichum gorgonifer]|uniref:Histone deacetylase domain-containing protein n=1 Tax=Cephalotrichum gorgonifer TaxID=2041049 RepID=A0AAE8MU41_9PEZI|nr:uncharacterized protein DNG_02769 [Cephalotrichum gorgonifer]